MESEIPIIQSKKTSKVKKKQIKGGNKKTNQEFKGTQSRDFELFWRSTKFLYYH